MLLGRKMSAHTKNGAMTFLLSSFVSLFWIDSVTLFPIKSSHLSAKWPHKLSLPCYFTCRGDHSFMCIQFSFK